MKKILIVIALIPLLLPCFSLAEQDAREIVKKADDLLVGESSSIYHLTMTVERPGWKRVRTLLVYLRGRDEGFVHFISPKKERGTNYLKIGTNLWMYIPRIERVIKIPPAMMHQSIMGSDFSYDDIVKESKISEDYTPTIISEETIEGTEVTILDLQPKPEAVVTYGRLKLWVAKEGYIPLKMEYYTEKGVLIRTLYYQKTRKVGGRIIPTEWSMVDAEENRKRTVITVATAEFNGDIEDNIFTKRNLSRFR